MALTGYQSQPGILPNAKRGQTLNIEEKREQWRAILTSLAEEFHGGRAVTAPKDYPKTCRYCDQRLLCRLDLSQLDSSNATGEDGEFQGINGSDVSVPVQEEQA